MSLVFAGICSHAPGITGRAHLADPAVKDALHAEMYRLGESMRATKPDALILIGAEHFANFFMNNMPAYAMGMADHYEGPIEDPKWLGIEKVRIPGNAELSERVIRATMQEADVAYAEEWKFDHGLMVPLHFLTPRYDLPVIPVNINCQGPPLTPLTRAWAFGAALRQACDSVPERIALVAHRRHLALARLARQRQDQRGVRPRVRRPLVPQRQGRAAVVFGCRDLPRGRPGRLRDPHLHRGRRRGAGRRRDPLL